MRGEGQMSPEKMGPEAAFSGKENQEEGNLGEVLNKRRKQLKEKINLGPTLGSRLEEVRKKIKDQESN